MRILLAAAAELDLMLGVFDVVKAFTQSVMPEILFVDQPTGFEVPGKVCRLNMALEGTKQAAHLWQQNLNQFMEGFGFITVFIISRYGSRSVIRMFANCNQKWYAYHFFWYIPLLGSSAKMRRPTPKTAVTSMEEGKFDDLGGEDMLCELKCSQVF